MRDGLEDGLEQVGKLLDEQSGAVFSGASGVAVLKAGWQCVVYPVCKVADVLWVGVEDAHFKVYEEAAWVHVGRAAEGEFAVYEH